MNIFLIGLNDLFISFVAQLVRNATFIGYLTHGPRFNMSDFSASIPASLCPEASLSSNFSLKEQFQLSFAFFLAQTNNLYQTTE